MSDFDSPLHKLGLSQIKFNSQWLARHVAGLREGVLNLRHRPNYTTEAEATLESLEDQVMDLLSTVRELQGEYRCKPIYSKAADVDLREDMRMLSLQAAE